MFEEFTTGSRLIYTRYRLVMHGRRQVRETVYKIDGILLEKWPPCKPINTLVLERYLGDDISIQAIKDNQIDSCERWVLQRIKDDPLEISEYVIVKLEVDFLRLGLISIQPREVYQGIKGYNMSVF